MAVLLSRKRAREQPPLLRDLLDAYGAAQGPAGLERQRAARSQLRAQLQRHNAAAVGEATHARSQELFLSVVLEWQRGADWPASASSDSDSDADDRRGCHTDDSASPARCERVRLQQLQTELTQCMCPLWVDCSDFAEPAAPPPLRLDRAPGDAEGKKIGAYSPRARRELLRRYMAKRAKRLSQRTVRYRVRKTLANARPRVKGRFVKTQQPLTAAAVEAMQDGE